MVMPTKYAWRAEMVPRERRILESIERDIARVLEDRRAFDCRLRELQRQRGMIQKRVSKRCQKKREKAERMGMAA